MKAAYFALALVALTGCTTTTTVKNHPPARTLPDLPETVMVTYHVQPGQEAAFPALLAQAWDIYRKEHLVKAEPHVIIRDHEEGGQTRFVEIFSWASHEAPNHASPAVRAMWNKEMSVCVGRNGHQPLEGGEVELVKP